MIRYRVTTHDHLPGARLSRPGIWGNMPFPDAAAAEQAAAADAKGNPFTIERRNHQALPEFNGRNVA